MRRVTDGTPAPFFVAIADDAKSIVKRPDATCYFDGASAKESSKAARKRQIVWWTHSQTGAGLLGIQACNPRQDKALILEALDSAPASLLRQRCNRLLALLGADCKRCLLDFFEMTE
jgi:hypothetical protein